MVSGFAFTVEADGLSQASKRPYHLDLRFAANIAKETFVAERVQLKRRLLICQRQNKLQQRFIADQQIIQAAKAHRRQQADHILTSLTAAERNRVDRLEKRRLINKNLVERAKQIARQQRARIQREQEQRRVDLEQRQRETEKRRAAFLEKNKSRVNCTTMGITKLDRKLMALLDDFHRLGLPVVRQKETWVDFHALGQLIQQKSVILKVSDLLQMLMAGAGDQVHPDPRIFLSAYMIVTCSHDVMQHPDQAQHLIASAATLLENFERVVQQPTVSTTALNQAWHRYVGHFKTWRSADCNDLIAGTIDYILELRAMCKLLHGDDNLKRQLRVQVQQTKRKLYRIGGKKALTMLRTKQVEHETIWSQPSDASHQTIQVTNSQLAHELIVDPEFQLQRVSGSKDHLENRIRDIALKAYFDVLRDDIARHVYKPTLLSTLQAIRAKLLGMVTEGRETHRLIDESFDLELIEQAMDNGDLDLSFVVSSILSCIKQLCAPCRDERVVKIENTADPVDQLEQIMPLLDDMLLDIANFQLRSVQPYLSTVALDYERDVFKNLYCSPDDSNVIKLLPHTQQWIQREFEKWMAVETQCSQEQNAVLEHAPSLEALFYDGCVALLECSSPVPETWEMDAHRFIRIERHIHHIAVVASLTMICGNLCSVPLSERNRLGEHLFGLLTGQEFSTMQLAQKILHVLDTNSIVHPAMRAIVPHILTGDDSVYTLLRRRILDALRQSIITHTTLSTTVLGKSNLDVIHGPLARLASQVDRLCQHNLEVYRPWYSLIFSFSTRIKQ
ncbi:T-complex protein 11-domain-containing protein [Gongronella butleri]|nr:T-complex protein 11-domain-containing protein [Gongronella butleri]